MKQFARHQIAPDIDALGQRVLVGCKAHEPELRQQLRHRSTFIPRNTPDAAAILATFDPLP